MGANEVVQVTLLGGRGAQEAEAPDADGARGWSRTERRAALALPVVACELVLLSFLDPGLPWRALVLLLVALPFVLSAVLAWRIGVVAGREGLRLHLPDRAGPPDAAADAARRAWGYERDRYRRSVERTGFYAGQLGMLTSVLLAALVLGGHVLAPVVAGMGVATDDLLVAVGVSVTASIATAYLVVFVGSMVRLSSYDISARAFTWAARSIVLVAAATAGLAAAITPTHLNTMLVLGILTGVTGHHALDMFLDKANELLGMKKTSERLPSPLMTIDGVLPEHVGRLEEEGLVSIQDLAYAPTARLFFSLPYGLQAVCAWQDDALLRAKLGAERANDLFRYLGIRGAVAFRDLAKSVLEGRETAAAAGAQAGAAQASGAQATGPQPSGAEARGSPGDRSSAERDALVRALHLDKDSSLDPLLRAFVSDSTVERLSAYERAVVLEPAQFDQRAPEPGTAQEWRMRPEAAGAVLEVVRAEARTAGVPVREPGAGRPQVAAAARTGAQAGGRGRRATWLLASLWMALGRRGRGAGPRGGPAHAPT